MTTKKFDTETLDKAREMLCDMQAGVERALPPFNKSQLSTLLWQAFTKGRAYGEFLAEAKGKEDKDIEAAMMNLFCGVWQLQENIEAFFKDIKDKTFEEIVDYIKNRRNTLQALTKTNGEQSTRLLMHFTEKSNELPDGAKIEGA